VTLWVAQILLAAAFFMAAIAKLTTPIDQLARMMPWTKDVSESLVRFIGSVELLGAIGLILPAATRFAPRLTPIAAIGLMVVMVLAACFHLSRGEVDALPVPALLGAMAAFVAWGRAQWAPIASRL